MAAEINSLIIGCLFGTPTDSARDSSLAKPRELTRPECVMLWTAISRSRKVARFEHGLPRLIPKLPRRAGGLLYAVSSETAHEGLVHMGLPVQNRCGGQTLGAFDNGNGFRTRVAGIDGYVCWLPILEERGWGESGGVIVVVVSQALSSIIVSFMALESTVHSSCLFRKFHSASGSRGFVTYCT